MPFAFLAALSVTAPAFYQLQLSRPDGVKGTVVLNGVSIHSFDQQGSLSAALNMWLKPHGNTLEILLEASSKPLEADAKLTAEVVQGEQKVASLVWAAADGLPKTVQATFAATDAPAHQLWTMAETATLDDAAKKEIAAVVKALHAAVAKRDAATVKKLFAFKMADLGRAMGDPSIADGEMLTMMLKSLGKAKPAPLNGLNFTPMADGKLVRVANAKGGPPIVIAKKGGGEMALEAMFAHVDGRWQIVR